MSEVSGTVELLTVARRLLVEHGWCQGRFEVDGKFCAVGALLHAAEAARVPVRVYFEAREELSDCLGGPTLAPWNDDPDRTVEEVVALFDAAISESGEGGD